MTALGAQRLVLGVGCGPYSRKACSLPDLSLSPLDQLVNAKAIWWLVLKGCLILKKQNNERGTQRTSGLRATVQASVSELFFFKQRLSGKPMLTELIDLKTRPQTLCLIGHLISRHGASSPDPRCPQWEVCVVSGPASHLLAGAGPGRLGPGQSSQTCPAFPPGQVRAASWGSSKTGTVILLPSDGCRDGERQTEERTSHVVMPGFHGKIPLPCRGPGEGDHMTTDWTTGHVNGKSQRVLTSRGKAVLTPACG